ncbi:MAG: chemotaxis protein CheA [Mycobacteriales bacterium]
MDEIVQEFLVESHENLDQLDRDLVALERDPESRERLSSIFRTIHTIKGTSGFLAFSELEKVTHAGESLLSRLRDGKLILNADVTTGLLTMVDAVRRLLADIESTGAEAERDHTELVAQLVALQESAAKPVGAAEVDPPKRLGDLLIETGRATEDDVHFAIREQEIGDRRHIGEILVEQGILEPGEVAEMLGQQGDQLPQRSIYESTLRVDVALLDELMNLVGELVLARNQIVATIAASGDPVMLRVAQRLNSISTDLQSGVMRARMQQINIVWQKIPRVVRDICVAVGKSVSVEMEGQDTELDKTIIEAINAPLTHIVRNAVDHGIESPEIRLAAGKRVEGRIRLSARHESGSVTIEISDDGGGINLDRVRATALKKGLVSPSDLAAMSEDDITALVFLPGFSTAETVTNVSGRGVGMDVVRTNIEKIGGSIELRSLTGLGTTVVIKIPLTLAIMPALSVSTGGHRYAIPQANLMELIRLESEDAATAIQTIHDAPVFRLRDSLLPLVFLHERLGLTSLRREDDPLFIAVLQADDREFGLVVDQIEDTQEIVVKPLQKQIAGIDAFAGATVFGDGSVSLILDLAEMSQQARKRTPVVTGDSVAAPTVAPTRMLITNIGAHRRLAVPLSGITRLEELPASALENVGEREMLQYRGSIIPMARISSVVDDADPVIADGDAPLQVVVYRRGERTVGLVVNEILDIVDDLQEISTDIKAAGIGAALVIGDRITELLDVHAAIIAADPDFFADETVGASA